MSDVHIWLSHSLTAMDSSNAAHQEGHQLKSFYHLNIILIRIFFHNKENSTEQKKEAHFKDEFSFSLQAKSNGHLLVISKVKQFMFKETSRRNLLHQT